MADEKQLPKFRGVLLPEWEAAHAPTVQEFPAARFIISQNGHMVRIAFGQYGHPVNEQCALSPPRYTAAVSMAPALMMQLRDVLNALYPPKPVAAAPAQGGEGTEAPGAPSKTIN